jgi:hypothetical protein
VAYQFVDPFDHYNSAALLYEYVSGSCPISSSYVRNAAIAGFPNQGIYVPANNAVRKNLKSNQGTLITFLTYGAVSLPSSGWAPICAWLDAGTYQCYLGVSATGQIGILNAPGGSLPGTVLAASAPGLIAPAPTTAPNHGIEVQITFGASGSVKVWLDGAVVIALTAGLNTINSANAYANQVQLGWPFAGVGLYCDYLRVWDSSGSYQNAPVGYDVRKLTKLPSGAGALTQWTPNGLSANWQNASQNPPNPSDYNSSNGTLYDAYGMPVAGFAGIPSMTVAKSYVEKDDSNTRSIQIGVRSGSSNGLGAAVTLGSSYVFIDTCISTDPATGAVPTAAAADAFQHLKYENV